MNDGDDGVDAVCSKSSARLFIAALQKLRNERLQSEQRQLAQFRASEFFFDMPLDNELIALKSAHFDGRINIVFQPLREPIFIFHKSSV